MEDLQVTSYSCSYSIPDGFHIGSLNLDLLLNPPQTPLSAAERADRLAKLKALILELPVPTQPPLLGPSCDASDAYSICALGVCGHQKPLSFNDLELMLQDLSYATSLPDFLATLGFVSMESSNLSWDFDFSLLETCIH